MPSIRSSVHELHKLINEIERFIWIKRRLEQLCGQYNILMYAINNESPLKDYAIPYHNEPHLIIAPSNIQANNFELKPSMLQILH